MILSFAWTTRALLERRKTVTRRRWTPDYAAKFAPGVLVDAYDRSPRHGGVKVATIRVVSVRREPVQAITAEDVVREGFEHGDVAAFLDGWFEHYPDARRDYSPMLKMGGDLCYRLEFELVEICDGPLFAPSASSGPDGRTTK